MIIRKNIIYAVVVALLIGLLPHTYYAASFNHVDKVLTVMEGEVLQGSEAPVLNITLLDSLEKEAIFYIELSGGKWLDAVYIGSLLSHTGKGSLEIKPINDTKLQVKVKGESLAPWTTLQIPLWLQMTSEQAQIAVKGNNTVVSSGIYEVAKASSYKGNVLTFQVPTATDSGVMADLVIEEPFSKAFSKAQSQGKSNVIELRLNHNGYAFNLADSQVTLEGLQGFEGLDTSGYQLRQIDAQTLALTLPDISEANYTGAFRLSGVQMQVTDKVPQFGMINMTVSGDLVNKATVDVLEVLDYAIELTASSSSLRAGSKQTVCFTLEEKVAHSLVRSRPTYFSFDGGVYLEAINEKVNVKLNGETMSCYAVMEGDKAVGFEVLPLPEDVTSYHFEVEAVAPITAIGNIKVSAEGRSLIETLSTKILEVYAPFEISVMPFTAYVGIKDQSGGEIIVSENKMGEFIQGEDLVIELEESNISYSDLPKVEVTKGDLRIGSPVKVGTKLVVPIVRSSHEASTIKLSDFKVTLDQTIAEGDYEVSVGGRALSMLATTEEIMPAKKAAFMKVAKLEATGGSASEADDTDKKQEVTVCFTLGSKMYYVGDKGTQMEAAPYASGGRIMLPIRYTADALMVTPDKIYWDNQTKTATIDAGQKVSMTLGSKVMTIDGKKVTMTATPEIKGGRIFIPVAEITRALQITTQWDNQSKQVTFQRPVA